MVRAVSKNFPNARVVGIEMMPSPFVFSSIKCVFNKNIKIVFGNAFRVLRDKGRGFDVGIAYLLTPEMKNVENLLSRFKILLAVDFPLPDVRAAEEVKLHRDMFGQHWLYVYKK
jgi:hypothetical protein